jgi:branched-chain amino acid aminotransferase
VKYIYVNDQLKQVDSAALQVNNRGFRYGDGLFETMKIFRKSISLQEYHFNRLFESLKKMKMKPSADLSKTKLTSQVFDLCEKNECNESGRIRLSVFRGNGGLYETDPEPQYLIESWPIEESVNRINDKGYIIDIYTEARKSCDKFSNLKSANFLPYVMAAKFAIENSLNDCLVLNVYDRIADATIANVFVIKNEEIITPPLTEGCIDGVMRKYLIEKLEARGYNIAVRPLERSHIENADEIFLTNAIAGIRWVGQFGNREYTNKLSSKIYRDCVEPLWS